MLEIWRERGTRRIFSDIIKLKVEQKRGIEYMYGDFMTSINFMLSQYFRLNLHFHLNHIDVSFCPLGYILLFTYQ